MIIGSVTLAATGQVMMRLGMSSLGGEELVETILAGLAEPLVLLGFACFVISSLSWLIVLSRVPLSVAYPFGALSYVIVVLVALITGEQISALRWTGVALIVAGIWLVGGNRTGVAE
jgi:drug/metabolite transporter (DMT)-like permease